MGAWASPVLETLAAALGGLLAFILAGALALKALPFSLASALDGRKNPAAAVVFWSLVLGLGIIIAAASAPGR
ncbi:MAG TPA: DUF350 domain-containing protein [Polyangiaceae bacterium]|nr:DUF350 domain-containing protein [Polyangiaceae bacterium]